MNIIAVGAHLDDIELACGGTLARAVKAGHRVKMVVLSASAYTYHDGRVLRDQETALTEGREAIAGAICKNVLNGTKMEKAMELAAYAEAAMAKLGELDDAALLGGNWKFPVPQQGRPQ